MYRLLRPLVSLAFLLGTLWFAFSVKLGGRTLAGHIDRIGQTPEANDLIEGTRATVNPVLQEATDRMLGEHIVAPTRADPTEPATGSARTGATHAKTAPRRRGERSTSTPEHTKLPGQR